MPTYSHSQIFQKPATLRWKVAQALEYRWWRRYFAKQNPDEYLKWKKAYWLKLLKPIEHLLPLNGKALDAGCGPAGIYMALERYQTVAFDPLLNRYVSSGILDTSLFPTTEFFESTLEKFNSEPEYDMVFCMNCINHVADIQKSTANLASALKPGGILIMSIDAHNHNIWKRLFRLIPGDVLHPHQYDLSEYKAMITATGCKLLHEQVIKKEYFFNHHLFVFKWA